MIPTILLCHVRGIEDLASGLLKRAECRLVALHQQGSILLQRAGIPHTPFEAFLSDALLRNAMGQAQTRLQQLAQTLRNAPSLWPHLRLDTWQRFAPLMMDTLQRDIPEQIVVIEVIRRITAEHALKLLITPEDVTRDARTAVLAARRFAVPSLHILHGVNAGTIAAHASIFADRFAVYSEHTRAHYTANGISPDRIVVTGNPAWDSFARPPDPNARALFCQRSELDPSRPILVYAMTSNLALSVACIDRGDFPARTTEATVLAFAELARRQPHWQFVLRPHPSEFNAAARFVALAREHGLDTLRIEEGPAYECVMACDVFACTHSNMGIEAILAGKPVVNIALEDELGDVFDEGAGPLFDETDAVLWARKRDAIAPALERAILDGAAREQLRRARPTSIERFNGNLDGKAMERICGLALAMTA